MSKEERFISLRNSATLGRITYELKKFVKLKKASDSLFFGFKPVVRGVAKNPVDHPHGGGEARTTAGQPSVSPWGIYTKGVRTTTRFLRKNIKFKWGFF
jgi:large subunit ribosomal protein L2